MQKTALGWVLFWVGIFVAIYNFSELIFPPRDLLGPIRPDPVEVAGFFTLAGAIIWGGWKLAHRKGGKK